MKLASHLVKLAVIMLLLVAVLTSSASVAQRGFNPAKGCNTPVRVELNRLIQCRCLPASLKQRPVMDEPDEPHLSQRTTGFATPVYPARAKAKKITGTVELSLGIDGTGRVRDVIVIKGAQIFLWPTIDASCSSWLTPRQLREFKQSNSDGRYHRTIAFVPE